MNIWIPYVVGGSGTDVFSENIAEAFARRHHRVELTPIAHWWQYAPWGQKRCRAPAGTEIILTNSWNGFAFKRVGVKMVTVIHLCVHDEAYAPYRSGLQGLFHSLLVRNFERASLSVADASVAVSRATAAAAQAAFGVAPTVVIPNGIDTHFYCPGDNPKEPVADRSMRLLFIGNPTKRKGADLLPKIVRRLGRGFELRYTSGLRDAESVGEIPNMKALGKLDRAQTLSAYRNADILLFPSRMEGLPLVAMESLACGTPVVGTRASSIPEVVEDGITGILCPLDDVEAFARAVVDLRDHPQRLIAMGQEARRDAVARFSVERMADRYLELFHKLLNTKC